MAKFRKVHTAFWDDLYIEKLSPEDRYFYLFLLTNPLCTECGIYEISLSKICSYTGYNLDTVRLIIKRFISSEKILYNEDTYELAIINKMRYIDRLGKPVLDCLKSELRKIKDIEMIKQVGQNSHNEQITSLFEEEYTIRAKKNTIRPQEKHDTSAEKRQEEEEEKEEEKERSKNSPKNIFINSNLNRQPNIPTKEKVWEVFNSVNATKEMAKSFYEKYDSTGWFINGSPIINFRSLANKFIDNWNRNEIKKEKPKEKAEKLQNGYELAKKFDKHK